MKAYLKEQLVIADVQVADSFLKRFVGLMGKHPLKAPQALLIKPCNSIHTLFMRFPIDVLFLSAENKVLKVLREVPPNRVLMPVSGASQVLELTSSTMILEGDELEFR